MISDLNEYSDEALSSLLKNGDPEAFSILYERHWGALFRHAIRMVKDEELAKDVVQDVFTTLWAKSSEIENSSVTPYLYASIRNKILNLFAREKVKSSYLLSISAFIATGENVTDHKLREQMLAAKIEKEISLLPKKMQEVFRLSRVSHLGYREISEHLDISDKTVKKQISNALKTLRPKLGPLVLFILSLL